MNLYLLLALAFGAMTADAPVARASVILSRADGEGSQAAKAEILPLRSAQGQDDGSTTAPVAALIRSEVPLTGGSSPRAPSTLG
jgi:hypothetical protein